MADTASARIAYFSMEFAVDPSFPTYAGGLGVLAGDMMRSAADFALPMVGVTLLYWKGYLRQKLDGHGRQTETSDEWHPEASLELVEPMVSVILEGRRVHLRAWCYWVQGRSGHVIPVYFLDSNLDENAAWDRTLTDFLYGGDEYYRLCQNVILGIGGVRLLRALGYSNIDRFHMNEGHSALLAVALMEERVGRANAAKATEEDIEAVRRQCIFTTHTPVPAGQDQFSIELVGRVLGLDRAAALEATGCFHDGRLNMTFLGLRCSRYINGVAMHHGEISHGMYPNYPIHAITNGVHAITWTSQAFQELFDRHIPEWRRDKLYLRYVVGIPVAEIQQAHAEAKREMIQEIASAKRIRLSEQVATLGFARRATSYKRADLFLADLPRLRAIQAQAGPFQIIYGGKAHPRDEEGKAVIQRILQASDALRGVIPVVYIENYDMRWARLLTSGVDLWLNTPHRPYEASGTSGMKAALNGVPSLSVLDGWWLEGHYEGVTGWAIGEEGDPDRQDKELASLYDKLENVILPMFYQHPKAYGAVMRSTIALNGSFFNTQRMVSQYVLNAYFLQDIPWSRREQPPNGTLAQHFRGE
jgi:glycogen phosphorylase